MSMSLVPGGVERSRSRVDIRREETVVAMSASPTKGKSNKSYHYTRKSPAT